MEGKGLVKSLLILVSLVCVYQFIYFIPTNRVENEADNYAQMLADRAGENLDKDDIYKVARASFLDSISGEVVFSIPLLKDYTYSELKGQQLNFGLDLKGGMSTVLQVDLEELLKTLAGPNKNDEYFNQALSSANEALKNSQSDFISLFVQEYRQLEGAKSLATLFMRSELLEGIDAETTDGQVERILREKGNETVGLTFNMLKKRIDKLGVAQPNVTLDANRDLILVELPGIENPERAKEFLVTSAKLEFWDTYRFSDPGILAALNQSDSRLKAKLGTTTSEVPDSIMTVNYDDDGNELPDSTLVANPLAGNNLTHSGPLLEKFIVNQGALSPSVIGMAFKNDREAISEMLANDDIRPLFPKTSKFLWGKDEAIDYNTGASTGQYELYLIKTRSGSDKAPLEGDVVTAASYQPDPVTNEPTVSLRMDKRGAKEWAKMTTLAAQNGNREVAIVLDDEVVSAPRVNGAITGGSTSIEGNYTVQEANDFANILEVGKLPAKTNIIQSSTVGPSLGKKNITRSLNSLMAGLILILVFMVFYYGGAGIVAIIALITNLVFIIGALSSIGAVMTVPGFAGLVLTVGMAVDANVIIFERVREELRSGKTLLASIKDGFLNSYSAIIDANVTTLLVAFVLAYFGLGPIKGFAVVLIIGVISSLFTAVLFGKLMMDTWTGKGKSIAFWTPITKNAFANLNIDWVGKRKIAYVISSTIIILGLASIFTRGFDLGVDFKGGYSYNVQLTDEMSATTAELSEGLREAFGTSTVVKAVDTDNTYNIVTSYLIDEGTEEATDNALLKLHEGISQIIGQEIAFEDFKDYDASGVPHITSSSKVLPTIADDIKTSSYYAGIFSLLLIFLYIFIRFSKWQYSLGAVAALFHDSLIVLGLFSILWNRVPFSLEIDQAFIAAILTVIGYSINDTVVVFDRIREYLGIYTNKTKDEVLNLAINSTFSRTIITSLTTLLVVGILFVFGGGSIKGFAFALLVGIVVGTYSSIFVATPIVRDLTDDLKSKKTEEKKSFSRAASKT